MSEQRGNLGRALELVRSSIPGPEPTSEELDAQLDAIHSRMAIATVPPKRRWLLLLAAAVLSVIALVIFIRRPRPLSYVIDGGTAENSFVRTAEHSARLSFSDQSTVDIDPRSRLRIVECTSRGAHLVLENGRVTAHVIHESATEWTIGAGPYEVHVVGTRFEVEWHADAGWLDVRVVEGAVRLTGPSEDAIIRAPQGFHVEAIATPAATSAAPPPQVEADAAVIAPEPHLGPKPVTWSARVAKGEFQVVIDEAQRRGESNVLDHGTAADLTALADAARYTGRIDLAKHTLEAQRARFRASDAAFLLGKIAEDNEHVPAAAIADYDAYLADAPSGTYAQEALGRKMMLERSTSPAAARTSAERYLRMYPDGSYAAVARQISNR